METVAHRRLKRLAVGFVRAHGGLAVATEVRCPISRYRVDVAAWVDTHGARRDAMPDDAPPDGRSRRRPPRTIMIECKQSRADFLRDRRDLDRLLRARASLERFRRSLEENRVKVLEPELRRAGSSLFPELEEWDFGASRLPAYRDVLRRIRRLDSMVHGETKFFLIARYALADRLYLAAPRGMIRRRELPAGWGLLECARGALRVGAEEDADLFGDHPMRVAVPAPALDAPEARRLRLLRNIAIAASRSVESGSFSASAARSAR